MSVGVPGKFLFALSPLLCAVLAPVDQATAQSLRGLRYEDPVTGFRFRIPRDYERIPVQEDERWIVAMFQSSKEFTGSVKDGDSGWGRKPMLKVILFDQAAIAKTSKIELGGGVTIDRGVPYRDYKDYARRNLAAGGYYFELEEQDEIKKVPVTKYEIKIDKNTPDRMRYIAWVFHGDGFDIALEVDLLEDQYRRQRNLISASFRTLEFLEREVTAEVEARPAGNRDDDTPWEELSAAERMAWRTAEEERREKRLRDRLPVDWNVTRSDELLVMTHGGRTYTKNVIDMAEACRKYLHERFGSLSDEYVRRAVIRICRDRDEYLAFYLGGSADAYALFASENSEIVDYAEYSPSLGRISNNLFLHYLRDKSSDAYFYAPYWLRAALTDYMGTVQLKGRRLVFEHTADEEATFAELRRSDPDAILTPREIMEAKAFTKTVTYQEYRQFRNQLVTFLRFLEGPAKRLDLFDDRDFVIEYLNQVIVSTKEIKKKNPVRMTQVKEATTEEEEEQQARERSARSKQYADAAAAQQDAILAAVHAVVADWTVEEWETVDEAYERYWKTR